MKRTLVLLAVALVATAGCDLNKVDPGGGASSPSVVSMRGSAGPVAVAGPDVPGGVDPVAAGPPGTLVGTIAIEGVTPSIGALIAKGTSSVDPTVCAADGAIPDESFVSGPNGGVSNVFLYLSKSPKGMSFDDPESQTVLDQAACIFKPHGLVWRTGVPLQLRNSDKVSHNVQMLTAKNGTPNSTMPPATDMTTTFKKAEPQPFQAKCAIHPWMSFYALVVDHPFAAVTDEEGKFTIPNLPAGEHTFRVWHERGKMLETKLKVVIKPAPEETTLELKYPAAKFGL